MATFAYCRKTLLIWSSYCCMLQNLCLICNSQDKYFTCFNTLIGVKEQPPEDSWCWAMHDIKHPPTSCITCSQVLWFQRSPDAPHKSHSIQVPCFLHAGFASEVFGHHQLHVWGVVQSFFPSNLGRACWRSCEPSPLLICCISLLHAWRAHTNS